MSKFVHLENNQRLPAKRCGCRKRPIQEKRQVQALVYFSPSRRCRPLLFSGLLVQAVVQVMADGRVTLHLTLSFSRSRLQSGRDCWMLQAATTASEYRSRALSFVGNQEDERAQDSNIGGIRAFMHF